MQILDLEQKKLVLKSSASFCGVDVASCEDAVQKAWQILEDNTLTSDRYSLLNTIRFSVDVNIEKIKNITHTSFFGDALQHPVLGLADFLFLTDHKSLIKLAQYQCQNPAILKLFTGLQTSYISNMAHFLVTSSAHAIESLDQSLQIMNAQEEDVEKIYKRLSITQAEFESLPIELVDRIVDIQKSCFEKQKHPVSFYMPLQQALQYTKTSSKAYMQYLKNKGFKIDDKMKDSNFRFLSAHFNIRTLEQFYDLLEVFGSFDVNQTNFEQTVADCMLKEYIRKNELHNVIRVIEELKKHGFSLKNFFDLKIPCKHTDNIKLLQDVKKVLTIQKETNKINQEINKNNYTSPQTRQISVKNNMKI